MSTPFEFATSSAKSHPVAPFVPARPSRARRFFEKSKRVRGRAKSGANALRDHANLTVEQMLETLAGVIAAIAWYDEQIREGRLPGPFDPSLN